MASTGRQSSTTLEVFPRWWKIYVVIALLAVVLVWIAQGAVDMAWQLAPGELPSALTKSQASAF